MNAGVAIRGALYFAIPVLTVSLERATGYSDIPPANSWDLVAWGCAALCAGLISLRAFIDQHISNQKNDEPK